MRYLLNSSGQRLMTPSGKLIGARPSYYEADLSIFGAHPIEEAGYEDFDSSDALKSALQQTEKLTIGTAGTYLISESIMLYSNNSIEGVDGVVLKKSTAFPNFIYNHAILKYDEMRDANITLKNLTFDVNDLIDMTIPPVPGVAGQISFGYLDGLLIEDISVINGNARQHGIHLQEVTDASILTYFYDGDKDGFHVGNGCNGVVLDGFDISSYDDALAITASDYWGSVISANDIQNITIRNGYSRARSPQTGFLLRFITGSWADWASGNSYQTGDICVNSGNIYKKVNAVTMTGTVAPTHLRGEVTGSDGIKWRWIGTGTHHKADIKNINFYNVTIQDGREIYRIGEDNEWNRTEYPGTEDTSILDEFYTDLASSYFNDTGGGLTGDIYFEHSF